MHPAQRNKVDISKLNPQEQQLFSKYGKLPTHKNVLMKMQKDRKYFDSGDYALSKAGKAPQSTVGTAIPNPENIPHASTPGNGHNNGHTAISISPTNSNNPLLKESGLSTDENTTPPVDGQVSSDAPMSDVNDAAKPDVVAEGAAIIVDTVSTGTPAPVASIQVDTTVVTSDLVDKTPE